jgi:cell division protein FtsW
MQSKYKNQSDRILFIAMILLVVLGILAVFSASSFRGAEKYGDSTYFLKMHLLRIGFGLILFLIAAKIDYHQFRSITPLLLLVLWFLLVLVLFHPEVNGSHRSFIFLGKRFQPSEFMKLVMIFYLAGVFARGMKACALTGKQWIMHCIIVFISIGLVFVEPDLGSSLILFFVAIAMFFLVGMGWKRLSLITGFILPIVLGGLSLFPYQRVRVQDFINSVLGRGPMNYQVKQSIIGLAHGGLMGVGFGEGKQKLSFQPEPFSDFILASFGEEMGFIGIVFLFLLLSIILWRGIRIALRSPDRYGFLIAGGITSMVMINALINAGVAVNLLPTTGLTFPFLSYGGSSLFVQFIGIGILINISSQGILSHKDFTANRECGYWREEVEEEQSCGCL